MQTYQLKGIKFPVTKTILFPIQIVHDILLHNHSEIFFRLNSPQTVQLFFIIHTRFIVKELWSHWKLIVVDNNMMIVIPLIILYVTVVLLVDSWRSEHNRERIYMLLAL